MTELASLQGSPDSVLRVLSSLEGVPAEATGALVFGHTEKMRAAVLVERGRVCWAAVQGLQTRLTDLLRSCCSPPLSRDDMERVYQNCRKANQRVGETLVDKGLVTAQALRSALLHHTVESLWSINTTVDPHWVEHRSHGYQSAYTFLPAELLMYASVAARGEVLVTLARQKLEAVAAQALDSAVFDRTGHTLLACNFVGAGSTGLCALQAAGEWAASSVSAEDPEAQRTQVVKFAFDHRGGSWVGWRDDGLTFLVHCRSREDFSDMVRRLQRRGWSSAVHSSVPFIERTPSALVALHP